MELFARISAIACAATICALAALVGWAPAGIGAQGNARTSVSLTAFAQEVDDAPIVKARKAQIEADEKAKAEAEAAAAEEAERLAAEEQAAAEAAAQAEIEVAYVEAGYYDGRDGYYYAEGGYRVPYDEMYNSDGPSHVMPGWYGDADNGYVETYYSENVTGRHYLADNWTVDDEGFYHDENGRYVIGVNGSLQDEMPYGTVVMTGKGEAAVYDYDDGSGPDNVHDFYTNW